IPRELERICLKALAKRASERYNQAAELANDLRHWQRLQTEDRGSRIEDRLGAQDAARSGDPDPRSSILDPRSSIRVVPRGLHAFDATDADFFLELLPGARDRAGLP